MREIVRFLLATVGRLHKLGITHRDIRLANIVKNGDGSYGLIDWDDSVFGLQDLPNADVAHLKEEIHAPEMFVENGTHDQTVDLWSIGYLIGSSLDNADETLLQLQGKLMMEPRHRPSSTKALEMLQ